MVLGFVICLIAPNLNSTNQNDSIVSVIVQFQNVEYAQLNTYSVSKYDFQQAKYVEIVQKHSVSELVFESYVTFPESPFDIADFLSKVQFSRPPPFLFS